jgi:tetratricopeptide (TPR) repeat protein
MVVLTHHQLREADSPRNIFPTLETVNNLGNLYYDQGKLVEAEEMYRWALTTFEKALELNHTSTLVAVNNLAILYS